MQSIIYSLVYYYAILHPACNKLVFFKIVRQNHSLVVELLMYCCLKWICMNMNVWKWHGVCHYTSYIYYEPSHNPSSVSIIKCFYITYSMIVSLLANIFQDQLIWKSLLWSQWGFCKKYWLFFVLFSLRPYIWSKQCSVSCVKWQLHLNCHCMYM